VIKCFLADQSSFRSNFKIEWIYPVYIEDYKIHFFFGFLLLFTIQQLCMIWSRYQLNSCNNCNLYFTTKSTIEMKYHKNMFLPYTLDGLTAFSIILQ